MKYKLLAKTCRKSGRRKRRNCRYRRSAQWHRSHRICRPGYCRCQCRRSLESKSWFGNDRR